MALQFSPEVLDLRPWSVSKAGVALLCPRQFRFKYRDKFPEHKVVQADASVHGVVLHEILEHCSKDGGLLLNVVSDEVIDQHKVGHEEALKIRAKLPVVADYLDRIRAFKLKNRVVREFIEAQFAIRPDFTATTFDDKTAILRGVVDHGLLLENGLLIVIDHKSGKRKPVQEHEAQFSAYKLMAAAQLPEIIGVQCAIHYIGNPELQWGIGPTSKAPVPWLRKDIEKTLRPWLVHWLNARTPALQEATQDPPPAKTGWPCDYCGYVSRCPEGLAQVQSRRAKRGEPPIDLENL